MAQWQLLHANRTTQAALGYRVHHGPGGSVHYSTAPVVAAAIPDGSRSFSLSGERLSMQQLNRRLASYLQQVQCLEAANQRLEEQIQKELDRKCPRELSELDRHLRTASLLQDQISECLSAQAQVKLHILNTELTAFDLKVRCEKECEWRDCLEADLNNLRLQGEELQVHRLPELQSLLSEQTQQLMELQIQHQQDMQGLLSQVSGGVAVKMQPTVSSDLIQQLDDLRQTSVMLLNKNQDESSFNTQVSMLMPLEETFDSQAGSEVFEAELKELRRSAASLEDELTQLQAMNMVLEASGLEQYESFVQDLEVLQQRADSLCRDLDSVLQTIAQQAEDHQALLDIKSRLENEIQDYMRLLDGLSPQRVLKLHSNSAALVTSYCVTTSPSAFRRNIKVDKTIRVHGEHPRMMEVQTVSRGHIHNVRQTPVTAPLSETVTTVQAIRVHSNAKSSPLTGVNTVNTGSFNKSENQRTGAPPERTMRESMAISATINRQSSPVEVHPKDRDQQNSLIVSTLISQGLDKGAVLKSSKPEINTLKGISALVPDTQSARSTEVQAKERASIQAPHLVTHTTTTDPSKQTAAEVKKETETKISAQMNCTEGSIQAKQQDPAQVVSLSLETPAEAVRDVKEVTVTASIVSQSQILRSEEAQGEISVDLTLMKDKDIERQEKKGEEVEGTSLVLKLDQTSALSDASNREQNKVTEGADSGSSIATVSFSSPDSNHNLESKTAQGIPTLVPDIESTGSTAATTSKQITTETVLQASKTGTNIQTEITKTILCAEPENTTTTDPSKQTAAEVKKETETKISAQMNCTEAKHQDPAQVVSVSLETPAEAVRGVGEVAITASVVSGYQIPGFEEAQGKKGEEEVEGTSLVHKVMEDTDTGISIAIASSGSPDSNDNLESKTASTEILKKVELEENNVKAFNGFHDTNEVTVDPTESDNVMVSLVGQEALLSSTELKNSISLTDSGVALSSSSNTEMCLSPVETEVLMSMADQVFCPVDPEEHVRSPDLLLSPNDPEMFLSPNDSDTCLSPVEAKVCMSPNGEEEDEEACLNLTEANAHVNPVEKYILSTKEEGQSLSFGRGQDLPGEDRDRNNSKPTSGGIGPQLSSSLGGVEFRGPGGRSIIADKEEQLGFGGLYRKSVRDPKSLGDRNKDTGGIEDNKDVQNRGGIRGSSDCQVANMSRNSDRVFVKSASFGSAPASGGTIFTSVARNSGVMAANKSSMANDLANSSGRLGGHAGAAPTAGVEGRFRHGSGEWMVYGGSLGRTSTSLPSTESKERTSVAMTPATSRPETGRFGSRGSGEWNVYGGSLGRKSSLDGGASPSVAMQLATSPPEAVGAGRFGSGGSGEWMCYGGSLGRKSSLPSTGSEKSQSVAMLSATSQPETRTFGSRGSGEWRVYGGSLGRKSSLDGGASLPSAESPSVAMQLATSPPGSVDVGRFGSGGSGEWRVYGGSTGSLSSASSADRVSVSANAGQIISPPSSHISRVSCSGGRLSSSSVVKRSSSVGSGGRLSSSGSGGRLSISSGSHRTSCSGRFTSTGSGEWKPVYSSASARKSSVGSAGRSGGGTTSSQRAPSPGGRMTVTSGGWLNSSTVGGNRISSSGSGSKLSSAGSSDRISSRTGGKISSSSGSGRTNSTGGRVISSSDRPIRSTGSGAGGSKERISVCKMAALTISAAGRERSQDRRGQAQWSQQQQQAAATSPLVQRWLTTGVGVTSADPDGLEDIMRL